MTVKTGRFDVCADCGANLDPGEKCDCDEAEGSQNEPVEEQNT